MSELVLVAAVTDNGVIGAGNDIPWHIPGEQRRIKDMTMGKPLVMGRRTFESIGRPLPGRRSIVITRDPSWEFDGVTVVQSVEEAIDAAGPVPEVIVFGGGEIYAQTIDLADRLEITHVHRVVDGDTRFPDIDPRVWERRNSQPGDGFTVATYRRRAIPDRSVSDLATLLATLDPVRQPGEYAFVLAGPHDGMPTGLTPVVAVHEPEGTTLVVPLQQAQACGLPMAFECAWILLQVHSDLAAIGLTAAVAGALAADDIPCNVVAGFHHDHLFVPVDRAESALAALQALAHTRAARAG